MTTDPLAQRIVRSLGGSLGLNGGNVAGIGHSPHDRSVSIRNHPSDPNDVLVYCHAGDDWLEFKSGLRRSGLLPQQRGNDGVLLRKPRSIAPSSLRHATADQLARRDLARGLWEAAVPVEATIAAIYLREVRGIPFAMPPSSLRFHRRCPRGRGEPRLPALVAAVTVPTTGEFCGLHRIYLKPDGSGKADVPRDQQKRSLGPTTGAAVVLGDLAATEGLIVEGEGVETVLTVCVAMGLPGIATLSANTLGRALLPHGRPIAILADRGAEVAVDRAAMARRGEGRDVRVAFPPEHFKDFNELVRRKP